MSSLTRLHEIAAISYHIGIAAGRWTSEQLNYFDECGKTALALAATRGDHKTAKARNQL